MNTFKTRLALWLASAFTLVLTAPGRPAETAGRTTLDLRPESALARAVQPFVDSNTLAGAVMLVASKDKVLGLDAVGWSDTAARKPMATDALFWIASQSKPMTAAAFMMLVDEGKVSLDDPVEKYLKDSYGLGFAVGADWCGHGGAHATNMQIDRRRGLVFVWMVQHNGFPGNGGKSQDAFRQAALAVFSP